MRLEIRLEPDRLGLLPLHYREALQAMIYRHLPREIGQPLHDGAYWPGERPLKLFVFSQLHGEVRYRPGEGVEVTGPVWFRFASPERDLALGLAAGLLGFGRVRIATLEFAVREIATLALPPLEERLVVRALSPITVYRTLEIEGKRRTQYYNPLNEEFGELVVANLLEDLDEGHLKVACRELERIMTSDQALGLNLDRAFAKSSLSQVFPNSELVNPSNWKNGPDGVRRKYRDALDQDLKRAIAAVRDQSASLQRCVVCGDLRPAETFSPLRRDRLPLTSGAVNFYPGLAFGVELCGLCTLALRFLPLSVLRAGEGGRIWFLHCQELTVSGKIAEQYGWQHFNKQISAGQALDFYGEWRSAGVEGAVVRLLFQLLRQFPNQLRAIYELGIPAIAYVFSNDNRGGYVDALPIPATLLDFLQSLLLESKQAFQDFEHQLLDLPPDLDKRKADARRGFVQNIAQRMLRAEPLLSQCLVSTGDEGKQLLGGWIGHRLYLLEVYGMAPTTLAILERLGITLAQHDDAKKWLGRLERARLNELRAILLDMVRAQFLTARELAAVVPPNEPWAAGLARDVVLAVAYEWQRYQANGAEFPRLLEMPQYLETDGVIQRLERLAEQLRRGLQNPKAWLADLSTARTVAQIRGVYLRAVRQGALSASDFLFLVPFGEVSRVWQLRDYLLAFLFEQARDELPPDLEVVEGEEATVALTGIEESASLSQ